MCVESFLRIFDRDFFTYWKRCKRTIRWEFRNQTIGFTLRWKQATIGAWDIVNLILADIDIWHLSQKKLLNVSECVNLNRKLKFSIGLLCFVFHFYLHKQFSREIGDDDKDENDSSKSNRKLWRWITTEFRNTVGWWQWNLKRNISNKIIFSWNRSDSQKIFRIFTRFLFSTTDPHWEQVISDWRAPLKNRSIIQEHVFSSVAKTKQQNDQFDSHNSKFANKQLSFEYCEWIILNKAISNSWASCSSKPAKWFSCVQIKYNNCEGTNGSLVVCPWWTFRKTQNQFDRFTNANLFTWWYNWRNWHMIQLLNMWFVLSFSWHWPFSERKQSRRTENKSLICR